MVPKPVPIVPLPWAQPYSGDMRAVLEGQVSQLAGIYDPRLARA